jgi:hypothetical protein
MYNALAEVPPQRLSARAKMHGEGFLRPCSTDVTTTAK